MLDEITNKQDGLACRKLPLNIDVPLMRTNARKINQQPNRRDRQKACVSQLGRIEVRIGDGASESMSVGLASPILELPSPCLRQAIQVASSRKKMVGRDIVINEHPRAFQLSEPKIAWRS